MQKEELALYVTKQIEFFFPDNQPANNMVHYINDTLERVEYCFSAINNRYFKVNSQTYFNHLNSDQYAMFLYILSNTLYREEANVRLCEKVYYLNKSLHGIDVLYEVMLPDIFLFSHAVGTVLGRAQYSDYLRVQQNCTVGGNKGAIFGEGIIYPKLGRHVSIYTGASILGNCNIGDNCKISAGSIIVDQDLNSNSVYIGTKINSLIKKNSGPDNIWCV